MSIRDKIQTEKKSYKEQIELRNAVQKLRKNREYQRVIEKEFMVDECARYARISGSTTLSAEGRADSLAKAQAAGHLEEFLHAIIMKGNVAEGALRKIEDEEVLLVADYEGEE